MTNPLLWFSLSVLLVAMSLTAVVVAALPALQELARAARSAEKLFDTLNRELPPTLETLRLTGSELSNLSGDVSQNVQAAGRVVGQFDQGLVSLKQQAKQAQTTTRSFWVGLRAAWQTFSQPDSTLDSAPEDELDEFEEEFEEEPEDLADLANLASESPAPTALTPAQAPALDLKQPDPAAADAF
ncbi:MAG: hypothetical protein ACKO7W_15660 [Elainella sp.]